MSKINGAVAIVSESWDMGPLGHLIGRSMLHERYLETNSIH